MFSVKMVTTTSPADESVGISQASFLGPFPMAWDR